MLFGKKKLVKLSIEGIHCSHCVAKVEAALKALGCKADIDLKLGRADVTCPEALDVGAILQAISALGFTAKER